MALDRSKNIQKPYSPAHIENMGFDPEFQVPVTEILGHDGQNLQRANATNLAMNLVTAGSVSYLCRAAPGTPLGTAAWQCMKLDETSGLRITWADGDANWDNAATDPTALSYS